MVVREKTPEPVKPPSPEEPLDEEKTASPELESLVEEEEEKVEKAEGTSTFLGKKNVGKGEELE
ncbi:hypothetical protein KI387_044584, partial [Taxus chinensis]